MKTLRIFILINICVNSINSQNYLQVLNSENRWNYLYDIPFPIGMGHGELTYSYFISGDTVIENIPYKKILVDKIEHDGISTEFVCAMREDTVQKKVFTRYLLNNEKVMYSFNQNIGDTIRIDSMNFDNGYVVRYVKSIDTVFISGIKRIRVEICDTAFRTNVSHIKPSERYTDTWYEGIGSLKYLIQLDPIVYGIEEMDLLCFWYNETKMYDNPRYDSCQYANYVYTQIEATNKVKDFAIYPNPTTGKVIISESKPINKVHVINIEGKSVLRTTNNKFDLSSFENGFYVLEITLDNSTRIYRKIVKKTAL